MVRLEMIDLPVRWMSAIMAVRSCGYTQMLNSSAVRPPPCSNVWPYSLSQGHWHR